MKREDRNRITKNKQHTHTQWVSETGFKAQPFHTLSLEPDNASPSWGSHKNTSLVSDCPKIWALEAPHTNLLRALPCRVQRNNLGQIQMYGSGVGKDTHHFPWSLKSTSHGRSRSSTLLILPKNPLRNRSANNLRWTTVQEAETGRHGFCGALGHLLIHP